MKIILVSCGSRGDMQPMLALATALQAKGHSILLVGPPEKRSWAMEFNCPYHAMGGNLTERLASMNMLDPVQLLIKSIDFWKEEIGIQFECLLRIVSTAKADMIIASSLVFAAHTVAKVMQIPYRYISYCPEEEEINTRQIPVIRGASLNTTAIHFCHASMRIIGKFLYLKTINRYRKKLKLRPIADIYNHMMGCNPIFAADRILAQVPADAYGGKFFQTGHLHLKQPRAECPELEKFLDAGAPPIYAGFGSMPARDQKMISKQVIKAARLTGQRLVLSKYWEGPPDYSNSKDLFTIGKYPHQDLFPRMAAVIHHGGAGTTATAAVSGVPQIVIPYNFDQPYWGYKVQKAGLGPAPIPRLYLTSYGLARSIALAVSNGKFLSNAKRVLRQISKERSIEMTIDALVNRP